MNLKRIPIKLAAAGMGLTLVLAACGTSDDNSKDKSSTTAHHMAMSSATDSTALLSAAAAHMPMTADVLAGAIAKQYPDKFKGDVDGGASTLRANLTALLQEHVYLAGITTGTALAGNDYKKQAAALDENSKALSEAIASVYGDSAGKEFLALWRKHIGFFVDYTMAKASGDDEKAAKAKSDLDGYREDFGAFLASANPNLTKEAVADELKPHVESLFAAIDAQAAKSPDATAKLHEAAMHMPMTAAVLAGAIAKQYPDKFDGDANSGASELRAGLTSLLSEHVYLAGITTGTALAGNDYKVQAAQLDENSKALADAIASVYGDAAGKQFLALWRKHIGFFVDYTTGKATSDDAKVEKARSDLDGYRADFGAFLASANPNLTKKAVSDELKPHVESLEAAIDAQAKEAAAAK